MPNTQTTTFKGARYVTKFADPIQWDDTRAYEAIEAVQNEGFTYISKQPVPVGVQIDNEDFWLLWADPNAQMEQLRELVETYNDTVLDLSRVTAHSFENVEQMSEYENFIVGDIAHTNGFRASNDGGTAWYKITDELPEGMEQANDKDVIACGELFAILLTPNDYIMPEMVGAYGDGIHDDSAYISRAVELCYEKSRTVMLAKTYLVQETIDIIDGSTYIIGNESNGYTDSKIIFRGSGALFDVKNSGFCLRNLKIESDFQDTCAIVYNITHLTATLNANRDSTINDCVFTRFNTAIKASGRNVHVYDCTFTECNYGIEIEKRDPAEVLECRNIFIENCDFHSIGNHVNYDDDLSACVKSDNSALDGYIPYSNIIKNCKCQFSTALYKGGSYIHIIGNEIFAPNSDFAIIEIKNSVKGNPRGALTIVKNNNVYKQGFSVRFKLTRFMAIYNTVYCDIENNTICENCEAECIFITNSSGIVIKNNDFGLNANSLAAQASASGYCANNINRVSDSVYTSGGLTVENNVTVA